VKNLRILIADDHGLVRRGARAVLSSQRGWRVVGEAANGREAVQKAIELKPDVAVVDIGMPELDGVAAVSRIREAVPGTKVLVLTMHESDQMVQRALDAGAHGYILKSDLTDSLPKAVKAVAEGKRFLNRSRWFSQYEKPAPARGAGRRPSDSSRGRNHPSPGRGENE
jgi:DNA-binding NarL/FixJ family response regulator